MLTIYATTRQECDNGAVDVLWLYCRAICWRGGGGREVRCAIYISGGRCNVIYASRTVVIMAMIMAMWFTESDMAM